MSFFHSTKKSSAPLNGAPVTPLEAILYRPRISACRYIVLPLSREKRRRSPPLAGKRGKPCNSAFISGGQNKLFLWQCCGLLSSLPERNFRQKTSFTTPSMPPERPPVSRCTGPTQAGWRRHTLLKSFEIIGARAVKWHVRGSSVF